MVLIRKIHVGVIARRSITVLKLGIEIRHRVGQRLTALRYLRKPQKVTPYRAEQLRRQRSRVPQLHLELLQLRRELIRLRDVALYQLCVIEKLRNLRCTQEHASRFRGLRRRSAEE